MTPPVTDRNPADGGTVARARVAGTGYYRYLPITVPAGISQLDVSVRSRPGAQLGIGIFDPRGPGYQSAGFRGVAGAERSSFTIGLRDATPGFLAGPLPAGRWTVVVTVLAAWPGTEVTADVRWRPGAGTVGSVPGVVDVARDDAGWYAGDLHCHSEASSDAWATGRALTVGDWRDHARRVGLDFTAMTDHNTISQNRELVPGDDVLQLAGEEMTNWFHGHAVVAGLPSSSDWLDWRQRPFPLPRLRYEQRIDAFVDAVRSVGAFSAAAHPFVGLRSWQFMLDAARAAALVPDGIEVWNGRFTSADRIALRFWDLLLRRGRRITGVGGSDLHEAPTVDRGPGTPTTIVGAAALSRTALVDALRAGRVTLSARPDGPRLHVEASGPEGQQAVVGGEIAGRDGDTVRFAIRTRGATGADLIAVSEAGRRTIARIARDDEVVDLGRRVGDGGYVRFELRAGLLAPVVALTNPIWVVRGRPSDAATVALPRPF